jgi:hypothetical protein
MPAVVMSSTHHETRRIHDDPSRLRVTHGVVPPSNSIEIEQLSDADALLYADVGAARLVGDSARTRELAQAAARADSAKPAATRAKARVGPHADAEASRARRKPQRAGAARTPASRSLARKRVFTQFHLSGINLEGNGPAVQPPRPHPLAAQALLAAFERLPRPPRPLPAQPALRPVSAPQSNAQKSQPRRTKKQAKPPPQYQATLRFYFQNIHGLGDVAFRKRLFDRRRMPGLGSL